MPVHALATWVLLVQSVAWPADNAHIREAQFSRWHESAYFDTQERCQALLTTKEEDKAQVARDGHIISFQYACKQKG